MLQKIFKNLFKNLLFLILIFISISSNNAFAIRFLDLDKYDFGSGNKGVRVVDFDVEEQKFISIRYYKTPSAKRSFEYKDGESVIFSVDVQDGVDPKFVCNTDIFEDFALSLSNVFDPDVDEEIDLEADESFREGHSMYLRNKTISPGGEILKDMNRYKGKRRGKPPFLIDKMLYDVGTKRWESTQKKISQIIEGDDGSANNKERGKLGELATTLTMAWYMYKQYETKYEGDHGFDGVFWDSSSKPEIFITESKCGYRDSADHFMGKLLSEREIYIKLLKMKSKVGKVKETAEKVEVFINKVPLKIFKMVQRVLEDGRVQCLVCRFNIDEYPVPGEQVYQVKKVESIGLLVGAITKKEELIEVMKRLVETIRKKYDGITDEEIEKALGDSLS